MKISDYQFGKIHVGDTTVTSDVIVYPENFQDHWWRKQGHVLQSEDLQKVVEFQPEVLVVGTGYFGRMQIPRETQEYLQKHGIRLVHARTSEAVEEFNQLQNQCAKVVAALHLTC
jgi:hypothetical protein